MRYFNTAGPCLPEMHYMVPPEPRLPEARGLIAKGHYFVVHAPRQTGKTTTLRALAQTLTAEGRYAALHFSGETAEPAGDDYSQAQDAVLGSIAHAARRQLPDELWPPTPWPDVPSLRRILVGLSEWAQHCPRPLVLFFDEIDALRGESLRSVLRQLRDGYNSRPAPFPASVVLCGLRDVRDYKAASGGDPARLGTSSPFNIKVESLRIGDFTRAETQELYAQHTAETGQPFTGEALDRAWECTAGQPWLVNALARELVEKMGLPAPEPITAEHVEQAKERLIRSRATHLDSLVARLHEPRVRRLMEPLIAGDVPASDATYDDDRTYLRDLGLLADDQPPRIANPIYREVILRVLGTRTEDVVIDDPRSFVLPDGRLDFRLLLEGFAAFWCEHGEILVSGAVYHEVAPQLVLMAYLHRIVSDASARDCGAPKVAPRACTGGGYIDREYGVGRGRIDLVVRWPYQDPQGKRAWQREAVELKVWRAGRPDPLPEGMRQLDSYLDRLGLDRGTLVIFDRRPDAAPDAQRTHLDEAQTPAGRPITVLRA